jgi:hypothetical protein
MESIRRSAVLSLPTVLLLGAAPGHASDLRLNGQEHLTAPIGTAVLVELHGLPLAPAVIGFDLSPGPTIVGGESLPIGVSPAYQDLIQVPTDAQGLLAIQLAIPADPVLVGAEVYLLGLVWDANDPNGLDFSNGSTLGFGPPLNGSVELDLVGVPRPGPQAFDWITTVPEGAPLRVAIDPGQWPQLVGTQATAYVCADRTQAQWNADRSLVDVSGNGAELVTFSAGGVGANVFELDSGLLSGDGGARLGVGYDVVLDLDGDGQLGAGDLVDGYLGAAGVYVTRDPSLPGPYPVTEILYSGGTFLGQNLFYPSNVAELDQLELVIVSHGNGHNYQWYDHIGNHLASYGYVVMSHQNETGPGIGTASNTTLTNTDYLLGNLDTIAGGVLQGKLVTDRITWIGHSRGGEGITRAYTKLEDGVFVPANYTADDIALMSSIAPTVFFVNGVSDPRDVPYHLWTGAGDADVNGCAQSDFAQSPQLFGRAQGQRQATALYGVGHAWFHNGTGAVITGPCQLNRPQTHEIMLGYLLPLLEYHIRGNEAGRDYLWRGYDDLRPQGVPTDNPCIVVNLQYRDDPATAYVIDDFQTEPQELVASSGAQITTDLPAFDTGRLQDVNTTFTHDPFDLFNGATYALPNGVERGGALDYEGGIDRFLRFELAPEGRDWSDFGWLSLRMARGTRHPTTVASTTDLHFAVRLTDGQGRVARLTTADLDAGIELPYQRTGCGTGVGWNSEFETVRFALRGFQALTPDLDLADVQSVELLFGPTHGDAAARLNLDDLALERR